jgi:uncharacterized protein
MRARHRNALVFLLLALLLLAGRFDSGCAQAQDFGIAAKKPIVAGACRDCPWGVIGDVLKQAMKPEGYDLQVCYTCSRANNPRIVTGEVKPPATDPENSPPPPNGPIDFGITSGSNVWAAYQGILDYAKDGPRAGLRLIARIELPQYVLLAAKVSTGITDLHQIKEKQLPVKILTTENAFTLPILEFYGLTRKELESWGGSYMPYVGALPMDLDAVDVIISPNAYLGDAPEVKPYYLISARHNLRYFDVPQELREEMVKNLGYEMVDLPRSLFRGVDRPIPSVGRSNQVIYSRDDLPPDFAYTIAKAMDQHRDLLRWVHMPLSYDPRLVTQLSPVPLHPGAERYYREVGYLK